MRTLAIVLVALLSVVAFTSACDRRSERRAAQAAQRAEHGIDKLIDELDATLDRILATGSNRADSTLRRAAR